MTKINGTTFKLTETNQTKIKFPAINQKPTDNLPKGKAWLNNISGKVVDDKKPETPKEKFWVTKSGDSSKISDEVLKKHFHFDDNDIKAYTEKNGKFTINDSGNCKIAKSNNKVCVAATKADILGTLDKKSGKLVGGWATENGKVAVTLSVENVKDLQNFRQERVIDKAVNLIDDANVRNQVRTDLTYLATGESGQSRTEAASRLLNIGNLSETDKLAFNNAVKTVAAQPENKNNPLTMFVSARISLDKTSNSAEVERQTATAVKLAHVEDKFGNPDKNAVVNRVEAAWLNKNAAVVFNQTGNYNEANEREMMGRFYEVDDKERNSIGYPNGEINRWKKSDTSFVRPLSQNEINLREYQEQYSEEPESKKSLGENKFKFEVKVPKIYGEKTMVGIGGTKEKPVINTNSLEREKLSGSLRVGGIVKVSEGFVYVNERGIEVKKSRPFVYKNEIYDYRTMESPELNQAGINRGILASRTGDLLGVANKQVPFLADLYHQKTEKQIAYRFGLEKANKLETKYPVPPKPEDLQKERTKLTRLYGNDPKGKAIVNEMMRNLEVKSHAFWNR